MRKSKTNLCSQITGLFGKVINVTTQVFSSLTRPTFLQKASLILMTLPTVSAGNNTGDQGLGDWLLDDWLADGITLDEAAILATFAQFFAVLCVCCGCCCFGDRPAIPATTTTTVPLLAGEIELGQQNEQISQNNTLTS